ncbi:MAG: transcriptional regulator [Sulfobacillus thermosulfidooxidans]|uniref:HTH cro/C1-type domain-containing protein n=1 Tax=Sulfobacillus thermotolerans TaxID=338644 RepID=A0ABN5H0F2_9FIRM|nr:transcriptional regulator [Sulfobacillus sp. hq2]AUW94225.1 hypothetical protein BXT84_09915 [Sulfobacillus thermotolerans]MCY0909955.1 transcriptional regulator [Sulfobacillus thermotolerans]POB09505.1 transcriptional regulator [Sulfobacillus sp. hq2]PSR37743.1 MAG: transcriptional regulator [Sulfobacillus thermosulfidooxidans]
MRFGHFLRSRRQACHLSLVELARLSRTSPSYLSRVERGLREPPRPAILGRLADALDLPYEQLMQQAGYLTPHLQEESAPYGIQPDEWAEALATLSEDDWADVRALIQNKVARRKQGHSS